MAVITFSRQVGSRGSYIAAQVATVLGWRYYDREILLQAAATIGLTDEAELARLSELEEKRGVVRSLLDVLGVQPAIPAIPSASLRVLSSRYALPMVEVSYHDLLTQVITELAQAGNVVIMGRGGQVILSTFPGTLHIQVVAPYLTRVERLMEREVVDRASAKQQVAHADEMRAGFMRRYFNVDWLDPMLYDWVFNNSGHLSEQFIIDSIAAMVRRLQAQ